MKLLGANIFKAGTWNKQTFTEADLDAMVAAFTETAAAGRVPLKFGHADSETDQPFREGMPAMGWVDRIWRDGKNLFADFTDIPTAVYTAIQKGLYKFTSIELLKNVEYMGKRFAHLLDAVALLGAEPPAVDGLADLQKLALSRASFTFAEVLTFTAHANPKTTHFSGDRNTMTDEEIRKAIADGIAAATRDSQARIDAAATETAKFKSEADKLKLDNAKLIAEQAETAKTAKAEKVKLARDGVTAIIEAAVRAKKITPAKREVFEKSLNVADDEAVLKIDLKNVEVMVDMTQAEATKIMAAGKSAFAREDGKEGAAGAQADGDEADHKLVPELVKLCRERAKKDGINVFQALSRVVTDDPVLGQRFLDYTFDNGKAA